MRRGEVRTLRLPRGTGHEQQGRRFGVVVQADALLPRSKVLVAPTSRSARPATFRPDIAVGDTTTRVVCNILDKPLEPVRACRANRRADRRRRRQPPWRSRRPTQRCRAVGRRHRTADGAGPDLTVTALHCAPLDARRAEAMARRQVSSVHPSHCAVVSSRGQVSASPPMERTAALGRVGPAISVLSQHQTAPSGRRPHTCRRPTLIAVNAPAGCSGNSPPSPCPQHSAANTIQTLPSTDFDGGLPISDLLHGISLRFQVNTKP